MQIDVSGPQILSVLISVSNPVGICRIDWIDGYQVALLNLTNNEVTSMTTIAYHHQDQQIAVDSRLTSDDAILDDNYNKIVINELGTWVLAGCISEYELFITLKPGDNAGRHLDSQAFLIRDGKVFLVLNTDGRYSESPVTYNDAQGCGYRFAIAAMDFGKSAKEAVEYAMTRDIYTGGNVQVVDVKTGEVIADKVTMKDIRDEFTED